MKKLLDLVLLPAIALACALVSSALAGPERRLAWFGRPLAAPPAPAAQPPSPLPPTPTPAAPDTPALVTRTLISPSRPDPTASVVSSTDSKPTLSVASVESASSPFRDTSSQEAWEAFQAGARFLDARRTADYRAGHVVGAWCAPVWESDLEARITAFEAGSGASYSDTLVLYCGGGDCQDSHLLAGKLLALGYRNLRIYREGYPDWTAKGRPTRTGADR